MSSSLERYNKQYSRVLSCFNRITITRTLAGVCYAFGMATFIMSKGYRIFKLSPFMLNLFVMNSGLTLNNANKNNQTIEYIRSENNFRKEERFKQS